jgi:hypothetical protein
MEIIEQQQILVNKLNEFLASRGKFVSSDLKIKGGLFVAGTNIEELPDNLTIIGDAMLSRTKLKSIPKKLKVTGTLYVNATAIKNLPDDLVVYGNLDIRKTSINDFNKSICKGKIIRTDKEADEVKNEINVAVFQEVHNLNSIPESLLKLIKFQNQYGFESFCEGFGIYLEDKNVFRHWTKAESMISQLIPIGQANGCGSIYAFWQHYENTELSEQPIVAFGDEGGHWVVAENFFDFIRILTFDSEPTISKDNIFFNKSTEESENSKKFITFAKKNYNIVKIKNEVEIKEIVNNAQKKLQDIFIKNVC